MLDNVVREQLIKMLIWYFGIQTDFQKSPGKVGKYIKQSVGPKIWKQFEDTYTDSQSEHIWESVFVMGSLFRQVGHDVANHFGFHYPEQDDSNVTNYIRHIHILPKDAETIY
jgi:aminoglycoside 6-adenylyltransferase